MHPSLTTLAIARNVLVHRAGIVDQIFMNDYKRREELRSVFPAVELNKPLPLDGRIVYSLLQPVVTQSVQLIEAVNSVVGTG